MLERLTALENANDLIEVHHGRKDLHYSSAILDNWLPQKLARPIRMVAQAKQKGSFSGIIEMRLQTVPHGTIVPVRRVDRI